MPIDKQKTLKLLEDLVAIESVNPTLVPGARGEQRAAEHVREFLRANGIAADLEEAAPGRPNVVAILGSARHESAKPALMIVAHIDTVGAGDMREPFNLGDLGDPATPGGDVALIDCGNWEKPRILSHGEFDRQVKRDPAYQCDLSPHGQRRKKFDCVTNDVVEVEISV